MTAHNDGTGNDSTGNNGAGNDGTRSDGSGREGRAPRPGHGPADRPAGPSGPAAWLRDLLMGARFTATGGREGLVRAALTALAVGLGVAVLAIAASVPQLLDARDQRTTSRSVFPAGADIPPDDQPRKGAGTLLYQHAATDFRDRLVDGAILRPEGPGAPVPPGVAALPGPGEMVVSPALGRLLASDEGKLLSERFRHRTVGTIGDAGLIGPDELFFYLGSDRITQGGGVVRIDGFGSSQDGPVDPRIVVLAAMVCVVLLLPVAVLIGTAVRFGGEGRERRLAALRLVGAGIASTRRIAAGEALCGALLGLLAGAGIFLFVRGFAPHVVIRDVGVFPADVTPAPVLAALIAVAVPALAVAVTLFALRGVAAEPLGAVREAPVRRRRLWWRLLIPAAGLALLAPGVLQTRGALVFGPAFAGSGQTVLAAAGAALLLTGIATLLPWLVQVCVARLRGGPPAWQLATRRLQANSGPAARAVAGITVAVAGAVAVQMMVSGMRGGYEGPPGTVASHSQLQAQYRPGTPDELRAHTEAFRATPGVRDAVAFVEQYAESGKGPGRKVTTVHVAGCATLSRLAKLDSCRDGDVFVAQEKGGDVNTAKWFPPGTELVMDGFEEAKAQGVPAYRWTVPRTARVVETRTAPAGEDTYGILATPSAIDARAIPDARTTVLARVDPADRDDAIERFRNTAAAIDPGMRVWRRGGVVKEDHFAAVEEGLTTGGVGVLVLVGLSLLVATVEQLRGRRRALSVLVACGTNRSTLAWSVLWQTAIPVVLGLALATAGGLGLGRLMLALVGEPVRDWSAFVPLVGAGAAVIVAVTLLALPTLWRLTRPESMRTE
ncbi:FtsX-like permease family protein [Streptomyces hiroshimensis]|uniref:Membrane protein n=1 Tax=Streptomyces hiroshimensis TaxID=66424 RepID=A0ABQ2YQJ6_9ACTN|nr:FtsX-like permease family protein [Streptomyces hiroshimensis]GGX89672.1 membrane protein [Streptomyces hiroshimensis]